MPGLIEDYAIIGNCESAALVGCNGSIDWLALPRFDSAACFAALLGMRTGGEPRRKSTPCADGHVLCCNRHRACAPFQKRRPRSPITSYLATPCPI